MVPFTLKNGRATVFAYGQTGSGKTFTMQGIQILLANDLFEYLTNRPEFSHIQVQVSYFEIYGGRCQDLLNNRERLNVREDGSGEVVVSELLEMTAYNVDDLHSIIHTGNSNRTTHATESNDVSSRSHAVCLILLKHKDTNKLIGKISLIDLAGSERGADTKSHNRQRRMEGAEINKSLLALKECIRALDGNSSHVPYRASKLTLVLKDSFVSKNATRTVMIANVSPAASSADHTLNTLRYADRVKERTVGGQHAQAAAVANNDGKINLIQQPSSNQLPFKGNVQSSNPAKHPANGVNSATNNLGNKKNDPYNECDDLISENVDDLMNDEFHHTVEDIFEKEEELLNLHMNIIQENAELLTEEGKLLQQIQGEDYDIDSYATRLDGILKRKEELIYILKEKLSSFRSQLIKEEMLSSKVLHK